MVGGEGVGVALDDDCVALGGDGGAGEVVAVQQLALSVQLGLGAVEVFGSVAFDEAAGETDGSAVLVVDGEDESPSHAVVEAAGAGLC